MSGKRRGYVPVVVEAGVGSAGKADVANVLHVGAVRHGELQARSPALADDVVHLLSDGIVGERRQVGEGLEEPTWQ